MSPFLKLRKRINAKVKSLLNELKISRSKKLYLSFGENCLSDNILDRYKLKSFTTPFSHGRCNVEYILNLEKDNYRKFLAPENLNYEELNGKDVPRLKSYRNIQNTYHELQMNGFEFTHHDVIKDGNLKIKFRERVMKLLQYKGKKKYIILYHHRFCAETNFELLIEHLNLLKSLYSKNNINSEVILFKQVIIKSELNRKMNYSLYKNIHIFDFNTISIWEGDTPELLWAKCDDDLINKMIDKIKHL